MRQVIESDAESGDGVSIEREEPSTAFRFMPHIITFVQPQRGPAQMGELRSDHIGHFKALNETTNVRPQQGENTNIVHPQYRTGLISPDHMHPVESLSETFGEGDPKILGPLSGNGVFKPQDIDAKGSVIVDDKHFMPGRGSEASKTDPRDPGINPDAIRDLINTTDDQDCRGRSRPMTIWGNGDASPLEDSNWIWQDCIDVKSDLDNNDVVIGVKENIDWTAANGGPGSSYLTAKDASQSNAYVDEDVDGFMKLGDIRGELQTTDLRSDNRFVIKRFEPLAEMNSFGESPNPVHQLGTNSGPGASTYMTGQFDMPTNNIVGSQGIGN